MKDSKQTDLLDMNVTWSHKDLELYDNSFGIMEATIFSTVNTLILAMGIITQRTFYRMMKRLPGRAINQILYPHMVRTINITFVSIYVPWPIFLDTPTYPNLLLTFPLIIDYLYFQICVSLHMCLVTVYYVLEHWNYPLKNILGELGCHIVNLLRQTGSLQIQFHSFIMATTRYIFLFHDNLLQRYNLTTNVSAIKYSLH